MIARSKASPSNHRNGALKPARVHPAPAQNRLRWIGAVRDAFDDLAMGRKPEPGMKLAALLLLFLVIDVIFVAALFFLAANER